MVAAGRLAADRNLLIALQGRLEIHHVHSRLPLQCVALGDNFTHVVSFEDGRFGSAGLSGRLYDVLKATRKYGKEVAAVALGRNQGSDAYIRDAAPADVWFVMRNTGTTYMGDGCHWELRDQWKNSEGAESGEGGVCSQQWMAPYKAGTGRTEA